MSPSAPAAPERTVTTPDAPRTGTVLVLSSPFLYDLAALIAEQLSRGLREVGVPARHVRGEDGATVAAAFAAGVAGVLCVTGNLFCPGNESFARTLLATGVPVWIYAVDAYHRELVYFPDLAQFVRRTHDEPRLRYVPCEAGLLRDLGRGPGEVFPAGSRHVTLAALPLISADDAAPGTPPRRRLAVFGTVDVVDCPDGPDTTLAASLASRGARPAPWADALALARLQERLWEDPAAPSVPRTVAEQLGVPTAEVLGPDHLPTVYAACRWLSARRRLALGLALRGRPVDFIGPGWDRLLGDVPGFRHVVPERSRRIESYAGSVNLTTNWTHGLHPRVFASVCAGVPLLTPANPELDVTDLDGATVVTYDERTGAATEGADRLLDADLSRAWTPDERLSAVHSWRHRAADLWAILTLAQGSPMAAAGPILA